MFSRAIISHYKTKVLFFWTISVQSVPKKNSFNVLNLITFTIFIKSGLQEHLRDIEDSVPDHFNKANIAKRKEPYKCYNFPLNVKLTFIQYYSLLGVA